VRLATTADAATASCWAASRELDADTALGTFETVAASPGVAVVGTLTLFGLLGPLVTLTGPARAGVTSWWLPSRPSWSGCG